MQAQILGKQHETLIYFGVSVLASIFPITAVIRSMVRSKHAFLILKSKNTRVVVNPGGVGLFIEIGDLTVVGLIGDGVAGEAVPLGVEKYAGDMGLASAFSTLNNSSSAAFLLVVSRAKVSVTATPSTQPNFSV